MDVAAATDAPNPHSPLSDALARETPMDEFWSSTRAARRALREGHAERRHATSAGREKRTSRIS